MKIKDKIELDTIRPLSRLEIESRLHGLIDEIAAGIDTRAESDPQWIEPGDLVRRMKDFVVYN